MEESRTPVRATATHSRLFDAVRSAVREIIIRRELRTGQAGGQFVDGRLHGDGRILEFETTSGFEHCSSEQTHRPRTGDRAVVVAERDRGTGIGDELVQLGVMP